MSRLIYGVGYNSKGKFKSSVGGKPARSYTAWHNMIKRCYSPKNHKIRPTYSDCTVCDDWHDYQVFAKWFCANYKSGHHLDKDALVKGNKVYSPDTCSFISHSKNNVIASAKSYRLVNPHGELVEIFNMREFCRNNSVDRVLMGKLASGKVESYKGWTREG